MKLLTFQAFIAAVLVCAASPSTQASDFQSPRTAALGGAGHAGPLLNDAIYLNPSYASFVQTYCLAANYYTFAGPKDLNDQSAFHGHGTNFSLQDGRTELFQAGFGFTVREDSKLFNFGASKAVIDKLGVGIGGKIILPNDSSRPTVRDSIFSVTGVPTPSVQLVFVVDNMIQSDEAQAMGLYREFILGTKFNVKGIFLAYFDPHVTPSLPDGSTYGYEAGLEFPFFTDIFFRLGAFRNSYVPYAGLRGNGYATGLGWIAPRISFDYGLSRLLDPISSTSHTFGMTVYF